MDSRHNRDNDPQARAQHLKESKERALKLLPESPKNAMSTFMRDMAIHPGTQGIANHSLTQSLRSAGLLETAEQVEKFINDWD